MDSMVARLVSPEEFDSKAGNTKEYDMEIRIQTPFTYEKNYHDEEDKYEMDDDDVMIRGPVYVGNAEMLDRHKELVDMKAIMEAWEGYSKNPVILYNHSKSSGVIGKMVDVEMGSFDGIEEAVPIGRAIIDGGEKNIVRKIRKGLLRAFSIGFIARAAVKECKDEDSCYMRFTKIEWLETSVVDVPASPNALFNVEKHIIGYEDMGDRIAVLFAKDHDDEEEGPSEDPPVGGDMEAPNENSATSDCECHGIESNNFDKSGQENPEDDEDDEISPIGTFDSDGNLDIESRLELIEAHLDAIESKSSATNSFNTPLAQDDVHTEGTITMSEQEIIKAAEEEEVVEEVLEEAPEEVVEEAAEEVVEETTEEVEEVVDEVVEEVAEATEEESFQEEVVEKESDETNAVLIEVVKTLSSLHDRIGELESKFSVPDLSEEVAELKATIEAKDVEIAELKSQVEAAEKEAEIEAEVSKRVAEKIGTLATKESNPKSLIATTLPEPKVAKTFDPTPEVSKGMNGLAHWLEAQIGRRGV